MIKQLKKIKKTDGTAYSYEVIAMATNMYMEARNQGYDGLVAVGNVVKNRANIGGWWGSNIIDVIFKPWQFSWTNTAKKHGSQLDRLDSLNKYNKLYMSIVETAQELVNGYIDDNTGGATMYYSPKAMIPAGSLPRWNFDKLQHTATIGDHIFYREV